MLTREQMKKINGGRSENFACSGTCYHDIDCFNYDDGCLFCSGGSMTDPGRCTADIQ